MFEKKHQNSGTLGKDTINKWIISFLSVGKRGFKSNFDLASIFLLILKRLKQGYNGENFQLKAILKKVKSLGKMSITTSINGVKMVVFSEILNLIPEMESNQMFILMKNCTKIGLKLNKQMVGLTDIKV